MKTINAWLLFLWFCLWCSHAAADTVQVAVASNFTKVAQALVTPFHHATGHDLKLAFGSSGKFVAQITHGAPFDVFLSADTDKPRRLLESGLATGPLQIYAIGQLVLWSSDSNTVDSQGKVLSTGDFRHLALANAKLAPYGSAARETIRKLNLENVLQERIVEGENISQTYQFVASGVASLGFVALSQVMQDGQLLSGSGWIVPADHHAPVEQGAVLLKRGANNPAAIAFLDYLATEQARSLIQRFGYLTELK